MKFFKYLYESEFNKSGSGSSPNSPNEFLNDKDLFSDLMGKEIVDHYNSDSTYDPYKLKEMKTMFNEKKDEKQDIKDKMHFYFFTSKLDKTYLLKT